MANIRTFIAFDSPEKVKEEISLLQRELAQSSADVKWESSDKFHVTIKFLGDVRVSILDDVIGEAEAAVKNFPSFGVGFGSLGAFPDKRSPRVIWIGCDNPDGTLRKIKESLDRSLQRFGFEIEKRQYHAHITLGRVKSTKGIGNLTPKLEKLNFEPHNATIETIHVMKSLLSPEGAEYSVLKSIQLKS